VTSTLNDSTSKTQGGYVITVNLINPCATYTAPSSPADYTYKIGTGPYKWTIPAWTKGDSVGCTYSETLTMSPSNNAWATLSGRDVTIVTGDKTLDSATAVTFTITSTLTSDPFGGSNNSYTFKITLSDPCKTATLKTPTVPNFSVADGATATQDFTDASDTHGDLYGSPFFCGTRTFTFTKSGSAVSWLTVAQKSGATYTITASPTSSTTELQTAHTITMTVASASYSSAQTSISMTFTVTVSTPACNCNKMPWTDGTTASETAAVGSTTPITLALPSVSSGAYTSSPAMRACAANSCATTGSFTSITLLNGSALPSWITTTDSNTKLSVAPTDGSVKAQNPWVIKVTYTPTNGSNNPTYSALSLTISCEITSFTLGGQGTSSFTYNVFDPLKIIDASTLTFTQVPACAYTFTKTWTYTIPSAVNTAVKQGSYLTPSIEIETSNTALAGGPHSLVVNAALSVNSGQGQTTTAFTKTATYTLTIVNPCLATTINAITFDETPVTVADGTKKTVDFSIPSDGVDTARNLVDLCGKKVYTITDSGTAVTTWAKIADSPTARKMRLTIDPQLYGSHIDSNVVRTLTVTTKFDTWTSNAGSTATLQVTMTPATCDCSAMAWSAPTVDTAKVNTPAASATFILMSGSTPIIRAPTSSDAAKATNVQFARCFNSATTSDDCLTTGSYTSANIRYDPGTGITSLPSWLVWDQTNQKLSVQPTLTTQ